jgi:hypothetical protein
MFGKQDALEAGRWPQDLQSLIAYFWRTGEHPMKKFILATTLLAVTSFAGFGTTAYAATAVPCEDVLKTLDAALLTAKLNPADTVTVADLKAKGQERCTAEDDRRADGFFNDALAIATKK